MGIIIIDAICGSGKTTWAIQHMNNNPEVKFIFCTPFLGEIDRVRHNCREIDFIEPKIQGCTKFEDMNKLIAEGRNISVTHKTFLNATEETIVLLRQHKYTLIIDEALDLIEEFNSLSIIENCPEQAVNKADINFLCENKIIRIEENGRVILEKEEVNAFPDRHKNYELFRLAKAGNLVCAQKSVLYYVYPREILSCFESVYVLTYMFSATTMRCYCDLMGLTYELYGITKDEAGKLILGAYDATNAAKQKREYAGLISIFEEEKMNSAFGERELSQTWYRKNHNNEAEMAKIKKLLRSFLKYHCNAKVNDIAIGAPKAYTRNISGKGYTAIRRLNKEERQKSKEEQKKMLQKLSCFVPLNARATNDYRDRHVLAYVYNMYQNPNLTCWLKKNGVTINQEDFALSCLIQWIFRFRIRDKEPVKIYLPSPRMRRLLEAWIAA